MRDFERVCRGKGRSDDEQESFAKEYTESNDLYYEEISPAMLSVDGMEYHFGQ